MFVITEPSSRFPWTCADTQADAEAKLAALTQEDPQRWSAGRVMSWETWNAEHEAHYLDQPPKEITAEEWDDMLNVLPPLAWTTDQGVNRFNMSEFTSGIITQQFGRFDGLHLTRYVRHGDRSTYLTPLDFQPGRFTPKAEA
jgi:hypothetical protein